MLAIVDKREAPMLRVNRLFLISFLTLSTGVLQSCGESRHAPEEKYFLIGTNIQLPYWRSAGSGFSRAASQLKVRAEFVGPDSYDPKAEVAEFQKAVRQKAAGILVSPADPVLMKPEIDSAIAAGIPVITIDSDSQGSRRLMFIGTNNYQAGVMGGDVAAKQLQGKGNVLVFTMPTQANLKERLDGYQSVFASHPQIKIVEVVDIRGDSRVAFDKTMEVIDKGSPKVDAFVCLEASAGQEVAEVLNRKNVKDKIIVAMDTNEETLEWIRKGMIAATIAQKPFTMAYFGLRLLDDLHHQQTSTHAPSAAQDPFAILPRFVDTGATLVDKNNLDQFMKARDAATSKAST
jgi:ribose transport system substrate-binding protein